MLDNLDEFTRAYLDCALWSSTDESDQETGGDPMDENYSIEDISQESLEAMISDCREFQAKCFDLISENPSGAGHDFWLTRNGHGAGFWDGDWKEHGDKLTTLSKEFGQCDLYVCDDEKIYVM